MNILQFYNDGIIFLLENHKNINYIVYFTLVLFLTNCPKEFKALFIGRSHLNFICTIEPCAHVGDSLWLSSPTLQSKCRYDIPRSYTRVDWDWAFNGLIGSTFYWLSTLIIDYQTENHRKFRHYQFVEYKPALYSHWLVINFKEFYDQSILFLNLKRIE